MVCQLSMMFISMVCHGIDVLTIHGVSTVYGVSTVHDVGVNCSWCGCLGIDVSTVHGVSTVHDVGVMELICQLSMVCQLFMMLMDSGYVRNRLRKSFRACFCFFIYIFMTSESLYGGSSSLFSF